MGNLQRQAAGEAPLQQITTMVVYLAVGKLADDRDTAAEDPAGKTTHMEGPQKSPKMHKAFPRDEVLVSKRAKFSFFLCILSLYRDDAKQD